MSNNKSAREVKALREGGQILSHILHELVHKVKPGITGKDLDRLAEDMILKAGGKPSFKNYQGFPAALCVSVNQTVVHGIPNNKPFIEGDIVGLDIGMRYQGLYTDMAATVGVGHISEDAKKLIEITKQALAIGISQVAPGNYIGDIGRAIEEYVKPHGYGIVRDLAGHGVGYQVHEDPLVPNYDTGAKLEKMSPGMVIAIEPMLVLGGSADVVTADNGWDVNSADDSLTAHFEHTIAVTDRDHLIITK